MNRKFFIPTFFILLTFFLFSTNLYAQTDERPFEVGGFLTIADFKDSVGEKPLGFGGRAAYNFTKNVALDGEVAYFPENPSGNFGQTIALVGVKAGVRGKKFGAFAKVRPGIAHFGGDFFKVRNGSQSYFALDVGGVLEYYPNSRVFIRFDIGDTIIPFGDKTLNSPLPPYLISPGTTHNIQSGFGVGFRF